MGTTIKQPLEAIESELFVTVIALLLPSQIQAVLVLLSFHRGRGTIREERVLDQPVPMMCTLFEPDEISSSLGEVGFNIEGVEVREPYDFEYPSNRVYVWGKK